jgi:beta-lactamase regulating signal transducer with metallopeptidase domain
MNIFDMSISAGVLILFIITLRFLTIHKLKKRIFVVLWEIALIRLLLPITIPMKYSIRNVISMFADKQEEISTSQTIINTGISESVTGSESISYVFISEHKEIPVTSLIWFVVAVLLLTFFLVLYIKEYKKMQEALPVTDYSFINNHLQRYLKNQNIKLMVTDRISTPIAFGIITPKIIFPKTMDMSLEKQLEYIMTHELVHIKRFDNVLKIIAVMALCIHWFNPLVWVMYLLINRDFELSCDEKVISIIGENEKQDYALALIGLSEQNRKFNILYNSFGSNAIKERVTSIMKYKKRKTSGISLSILLILVSTNVFATADTGNNARLEKNSKTEYSSENSYEEVKQINRLATSKENKTMESDDVSEMVSMIAESEQFSDYEKLGLSYNNNLGKLTYKKQIVGYFMDELKEDVYCRLTDYTGTIGIKAIRDKNNNLTDFQEVDLDIVFNSVTLAEENNG